MNDRIAGFERYLRDVRSVSKNTLDCYLRDIRHFQAYTESLHLQEPADISGKVITDYTDILRQEHKSDATVLRNIASIRCFYRFLISEGQASMNPAKQVTLETPKKKFPQILNGKEIELFLSQPDPSALKGCRDKAMLELLYATGIRVSELVALNLEDFNAGAGILRCVHSKAKREIPVYATAVSAVSEYLRRMRSVMFLSEIGQPLFVNMHGSRMTRQGFWKIMKGYAEQARISKEITPHTLRHSFALHLLENGAELKDIQVMLGYADISSAQVYARLMDNHFKEVYRQCHPRAKLG